MKRFLLLGLLAGALCVPASADLIDIYVVGSNPGGLALDPLDNPIGGIPLIQWGHVGIAGPALLTIIAEGIDTNQQDEVFFNGVSVGFLTSQGFQVGNFNLQPGPGALPGTSALSVSIFNVTAIDGLNTVAVQVDTENWVSEIETSRLDAVPEPATLALLGAGLVSLAVVRRRRGAAIGPRA